MEHIGVIPIAGEGKRMGCITQKIPKCMIRIGGKPILQYNIELMKSKLGIKTIFLIIGKSGEKVKSFFGNGSNFDIEINYIKQEKMLGIGYAIKLVEGYIESQFHVILGDEIYLNTNHVDMRFLDDDCKAVCGVMHIKNMEDISKNYGVTLDDSKIISLIEKPKFPKNNLLGVGSYLFDRCIFSYIRNTKPSNLRHEIEITDVINNMAKERIVRACFLIGNYININTMKDLRNARQVYNNIIGGNHNDKKISCGCIKD